MKITKNFVQMYVAQDCEGRQYAWKDVNRTYEEAVNRINPYAIAVREVMKEFDPETFTITETEVRRTER